MNDFSVWEEKVGEKQSRQSNSKYNFMQYVFFQKRYTQCTMESGTKPRKLGNFREFLTVNYRKNGGAGCTSCSPNNFVGGASASPATPVPVPMFLTLFLATFIVYEKR